MSTKKEELSVEVPEPRVLEEDEVPPTPIDEDGDKLQPYVVETASDTASEAGAPAPELENPLVVFINRRSGGQMGKKLFERFSKYLKPEQIHDLAEGGPKPALLKFKHIEGLRLLACGGDGTVAWVLSALDELKLENSPSVCVLPLGTGNDLSRTLGWGGGYDGGSIRKVLARMDKAEVCAMDRWDLMVAPKTKDSVGEFKTINVMNNYFSIGVDAKVALRFHTAREAHPEKFKSRNMNKIKYGEYGMQAVFDGCKDLHKDIMLECDGTEIKLSNLQALIVLNVPSYSGGTNLWGTKKDSRFKPQAIGDGLLEVVGVKSSFQLGAMRANLAAAKRLCQGTDIRITFIDPEKSLPAQIDGEPWLQEPAVVHICHKNKVRMLAYAKSSKVAKEIAAEKSAK